MLMVSRIIAKLRETQWRYIWKKSNVRVSNDSTFVVGKKTAINNCTIHVVNGSLIIGEGCVLKDMSIFITSGSVHIGNNSILRGLPDCIILIDKGDMTLFDHCRIQCKRIWVRFGGVLKMGGYSTLNEGSEVRCDEKVLIGSYCQISHDVIIWDTNTHTIPSIQQKRQSIESFFPYFGKELNRPKTSPVLIGDYCWLGERSALLKGTKLGNNVIVGFNTTIANQTIEDNTTVVTNIDNRILSC